MVGGRTTPTSPATYADIEALPEGVTGQLIDGVLYAHARPATPHVSAASRLGATLLSRFDTRGGGPEGTEGWVIWHEPELHLGPRPDMLVPDIAGWRRSRMPLPPFEAAPLDLDWLWSE